MMASRSGLQDANNRTLKRSFTAVFVSSSSSPERTAVSSTVSIPARKSRHRTYGVSVLAPRSVGSGRQQPGKMPSAAGPRMYENHIPSFMSVYDMDATVMESSGLSLGQKYESQTQQQSQSRQSQLQNSSRPLSKLHPSTTTLKESQVDLTRSQIHAHQHQHRESTSTQASDSTDSSPTTTISTVDSSSLSDPSPSSSPESPITLIPLSSFSGSSFGLDAFQSLNMTDHTNRLPLSEERPMTSPSPRKPKNPKALALNLGTTSTNEAFQASEPSSPSFIKPPPIKPRKKPSLLSLNTGAANALSIPGEAVASPRMPSMLQRRSLKHSVSSPQILSTPGFGPSGGMTLGLGGDRKGFGPLRFKESSLATNTFTISEDADQEAPAGVQMATRVPGVLVGGDSFDRPHSGEDAKSPSYPEGPILMHEPSVHLYLEPKAEEAAKFDLVINVAREVKNPFKSLEKDKSEAASRGLQHLNINSDHIDNEPNTAATIASFKTAFEVLPPSSTESSPTTPKPATDNKIPEYVHVPWDHNTDVKDELWDLCQLIESRVNEGKRVLVHCQQGASRSATLIIAYGMYINQDLGATEAYKLAQSKSKWVNPNMSLLFSLNDFKKIIEQKKEESKTVRKHRPTLSAESKRMPSLSLEALDSPSTPSRARGNSDPSNAGPKNVVIKPEESNDFTSGSDSAMTRFAAFDFGFGSLDSQPPRREREEDNDWEALMSPRVAEMTTNPLQSFSRSFNSESMPPPPPPDLFSPLVTEFPRTSFFPMPSPPAQRMSLALIEDPRSPPTKGEAPITRSIDDVL